MIHPTRSTLRAAREEHDRLKGYLPEPVHCAWCSENKPGAPPVSHGICRTCAGLLAVEDDYQRLSIAITRYGAARVAAAQGRGSHEAADTAHLRLIRMLRLLCEDMGRAKG